MPRWKRLAIGAAVIGALLLINWWALAMQAGINARPELRGRFPYNQFSVYYPVALEVGRWVILAVSLNLINGLAGQFSLGHAAFAAIGAYASAAVTVFIGPLIFKGQSVSWAPGAAPLGWNALFAASLIVGGLASSAVGFLVGLPSLRLRGDYLAIVTLGFGEVVANVIEHIGPVGGSLGFNGIPLITNPFWMFLVAIATIVAVRNIADSAHGRALKSIREDEVAAEATGVSLTRYKVMAFVVGAFFAGMAGGLFAHQQGSIEPAAAGFVQSIQIVVMVVLGGVGNVSGSVVAAALLTLLPEIVRSVAPSAVAPTIEKYRMVIYALLLIVLMLTRPQGLLGSRELSWRGLFPRRRPEIGAPLT
jgi:branched-chain amino acid transport system permease protein